MHIIVSAHCTNTFRMMY